VKIEASESLAGRYFDMAVNGKYMGIGIAIGIAIGAAIGVAAKNIPVWIGLGVAIGVAIGFGLAKNNR
jgi:hypothetical protein